MTTVFGSLGDERLEGGNNYLSQTNLVEWEYPETLATYEKTIYWFLLLTSHTAQMKDKNLVIMIYEDNDDHEIFNIALSQMEKPLKLLTFSDCEHALEHFRDSELDAPTFVFMNLALPSINGAECLVQLQKLREFDHSCIIIYSSIIPTEWRGQLRDIGVNKFVEKSRSLQYLIEQLRDLIIA